ncbi:MAG: hypothetical protein ACFCVK_12835 [Acidimicrobiales bacterium]
MSRTRGFLQRKAAERLPTPLLDAAGKAVLRGVDRAVEQRWDRALDRAAAAEGVTVRDRVRSVSASFNRELTSLGAATGAAAAAPGLGTASAVSLLVAEAGWFALRSTDLIMTIGAVYGRTEATMEERRAWVLSILAFGDDAADEFAALAQGLGVRPSVGGERVGALLAGLVSGDTATVDALRRINTALAARVVTRYGSRRGVLTIGKLMPFGVGAVVGGSANWALGRALTVQSRRFFDRYHLFVTPPPPSIPPPPEPAALEAGEQRPTISAPPGSTGRSWRRPGRRARRSGS